MTDFLLPKGHTYSTADVGSGEAFEYWNDMVCDEFVQLECTTDRRDDFFGTIRGCHLDQMQISEVNSDPQHVYRSRRQIAKSSVSEFLLSLQLDEVGFVNQDGRIAELHPGDFALYDSTRPYELHFNQPFRQIVLQIPYDPLAERFINPQQITATKISARTGVGALTSQFIRSVATRIDSLSPQDRRVITEHVIELVALSMGSMSSLKEANGQSSSRTAMLERLKQYIEINIRDPKLGPRLMAEQHGISQRYQRMLFASTGTTISRYIMDRRLALCCEALASAAMAEYSVTEIAFSFGFNDAAHFSRKFREAYGMSPTQYRASN